jgi:hypothetical protein
MMKIVAGPDLLKWARKAAKRQGLEEIPAARLLPRVPGDVFLCKVSPAFKALILNAVAFGNEVNMEMEAVTSRDSMKENDQFDDMLDHVASPLMKAFLILQNAQMLHDVALAGHNVRDYSSLALAEDMTIVGYPNAHIRKAAVDAYAAKMIASL